MKTEQEIWDSFEKAILATSEIRTDLSFGEIRFKHDSYAIITVYGGLNGWGAWDEYFYDLHLFIKALKKEFDDAWVVKITNDCLDDVFYMEIGVK